MCYSVLELLPTHGSALSSWMFAFLLQYDCITLPSASAVRRGSTPLPIKHQLRREEAIHDDCDWTSGAVGPSASPIGFSPALDDTLAVDIRPDGPLRIALLGQNGVGKSSLALSLAGDMDRTASVDSEGKEGAAEHTELKVDSAQLPSEP